MTEGLECLHCSSLLPQGEEPEMVGPERPQLARLVPAAELRSSHPCLGLGRGRRKRVCCGRGAASASWMMKICPIPTHTKGWALLCKRI